MTTMEKLGDRMAAALAQGVPSELVANVVATSHAGRLQALFLEASARLLRKHRDAKARPSLRAAQLERERAKALVDLVRARNGAIGARKPTVPKLLAMMDAPTAGNVVPMRKAA